MNNVKSPYLDLQPLKEDTKNNKDIYVKLIELFLMSIDEYIEVMDKELNTLNWPKLFSVTHKMISSIRMFGASGLEPIMLELECDFRDQNNLERIHKHVNSTLNIFNQVKKELQTELKLIENDET
ncbi:Hpt domain-containing protein [Hwangdonia lutea]|uniref:Hpt domain-containing protein n=1 Tax=Hwangdonia lutea TaxID=3075823 RepID=A0AA97HQJ1_9FLAO|nr:Hpt domain-containing protein [Hwangdonia sp. SCSIO 19198]WOD42778.1 Hpt domain-containing protein [Hwangdonia sp. SCSIO 19198]